MRTETMALGGLAAVALVATVLVASSASVASVGRQEDEREPFRFALQDGIPSKAAVFDHATGDLIWTLSDDRRASVESVSPGAPGAVPPGYARATSVTTHAAEACYVILALLHKWNAALGTEVRFALERRRYCGQLATHNDGPGGPRPFDHDGVDLFEATS